MNHHELNHDEWFNSQREKDEKRFAEISKIISDGNIDFVQFRSKLIELPVNWNQIFEILNYYNLKGWSRKDIYDFVRYIQFNETFEEIKHDLLGDLLGNLCGFCNFDSIIKLINEPKEDEGFINYFKTIDFHSL